MLTGGERRIVANVGIKEKFLPSRFESHEKESASTLECFGAVELLVKCLSKRDKVRVNKLILIMFRAIPFSPMGLEFQSFIALFGFLV